MAGPLRRILPSLALAGTLLAVAAVPDRPAPEDGAVTATRPMSAEPARQAAALRMIVLPSPPAELPVPGAPRLAMPAAGAVPKAIPATPAVPVVRPTVADSGRGRVMLQRIESGSGPSIEIAWPDGPAARRRLLRHLERCAGWRILLLASGRLWREEDPAGRPWTPPPEGAPSGLLRDLDGPAAGSTAAAAIRVRHRLTGGRLVATVARRWDARLLGGLGRLLDPGRAGAGWTGAGEGAGAIRARYAIDAGRLSVTDLVVGGRRMPGRVDLGPLSRCAG